MKLRCREGDLALIIREEPGCEGNIGRIVTVRGPLNITPDRGPSWLIKPVQAEPWAVRNYRLQDIWIGIVTHNDLIEHPDEWLLPIRPGDVIDCPAPTETRQRLIELEKEKPDTIDA